MVKVWLLGFKLLKTQNAGASGLNVAVGYQVECCNYYWFVKNVIVGGSAGDVLTSGDNNTAIGYEALSTEDTDGNNVGVGFQGFKNGFMGWMVIIRIIGCD